MAWDTGSVQGCTLLNTSFRVQGDLQPFQLGSVYAGLAPVQQMKEGLQGQQRSSHPCQVRSPGELQQGPSHSPSD